MRGKFITFEGPEGGGKTTQAKRLVARLQAAGHQVVYTREPGGTPTGEAIRDILQHNKAGEAPCSETEVLLFAASRAQLVRHVIIPALERGEWVVCDRFADSTTAYQGYGRGFSVEQMIAINAFAIDGAQPDLTILLDLPVSDGFARLQQRGGQKDRIESEALDFHERVRAGYLELAKRWPERFRIVDPRGALESVAEAIWNLVQREQR
jgi:dTMP kinase